MNTKAIGILCEPSTYKELRTLAVRKDMSVSRLIRIILGDYIDSENRAIARREAAERITHQQ